MRRRVTFAGVEEARGKVDDQQHVDEELVNVPSNTVTKFVSRSKQTRPMP
jgi:hypothetical protein